MDKKKCIRSRNRVIVTYMLITLETFTHYDPSKFLYFVQFCKQINITIYLDHLRDHVAIFFIHVKTNWQQMYQNTNIFDKYSEVT